MNRRAMLHLPLALWLAASCGGAGSESSEAGEAQEGAVLIARSSRSSLAARIRASVDPIPMNEPFDVTLELFDESTGEPIEGFDAVTIDARMPHHRHGLLMDVDVVDEGGEMRARGMVLHMVGRWEFHVDVKRGARTERAQAELILES